jgi:hypothetical protein
VSPAAKHPGTLGILRVSVRRMLPTGMPFRQGMGTPLVPSRSLLRPQGWPGQ